MVKEKNDNLMGNAKAQHRVRRFQFKFIAIGFLVISGLNIALSIYSFFSCRYAKTHPQLYCGDTRHEIIKNLSCVPGGLIRDCPSEIRSVLPFAFILGLCGVLFSIISVKKRERIAKTILVLNICVVLTSVLVYFLVSWF